MGRPRHIVLVLLCAIAAAALAAPAAMAAANPVVVDCTSHNRLTHRYTVGQLRTALATMPADVKEYTSCPDVIQRALNDQLGGLHASGGGSGSGGGSFLPTPVIVLLVLLILGGATFAAVAMRRGRADDS